MLKDYSTYKRVFAFGCSFTNWMYPTWADIIAKSCNNAEFFNLGLPGGGNTVVSSRLTQANIKYKFCDTDLILIMFTSPFREDRWIKGIWKAFGNIYNQDFYDEKFVNTYTDPNGLIIKDLAITETAITYINSLPCDKLLFRAVDIGHTEFKPNYRNNDIEDLFYNSSISKLPVLIDNSFETVRHKVYKKHNSEPMADSHPWPNDYLTFLKANNIPLSQESIDYALDAAMFVENAEYQEDLYRKFSSISSDNGKKYNIF